MKIYFAGQDNFGNRGCEALIRANVKTIRNVWAETQFYVPSRRIDLDRQQWPQAEKQGVSFVPAEPFPAVVRWWGRLRRVFSFVSGIVPRFQVSAQTRQLIEQSDVLIMTGGDIISLDYGLESLYYWAGICDAAMRAGKPAVLWAGSVGPFSKDPATERNMKSFLARFALITVRETPSYEYLNGLGLNAVLQVTDPAFALDPEPVPEAVSAAFTADRAVLGFNISPLILKFRDSEESRQALEQDVVDFLGDVLREQAMDVLLIPHVDPLDGSEDNSDWAYMQKILAKMPAEFVTTNRVRLLPRGLNAAQLKGVISRCSFFMGARTHATVAALSQCVPTTSIAYSIKAKGINQDLFGHLRYVLETPAVSKESLNQHLSLLQRDTQVICTHLKDVMPQWRDGAGASARALTELCQ